jgi:alanine racemase
MASALSPDRARAPARTRRAWAEIDLGAVRDNVHALRRLLRESTRLLAVVKADAYGHGAVAVAHAAVDAGAAMLGVATIDEGIELRAAGIRTPILLLGHTAPEEAEAVVAHDLAATVFQPQTARALSAAAGRAGRPARVHLKIDTGMGRIGVAPSRAPALARELSALGGVVLEGCCTHFATADELDLQPARAQLRMFLTVLRRLEDAGVPPGIRHAANSAAMLALPEAQLDMVRPGIALYGIPPASHLGDRAHLRRVMRLRARVSHVKRVEAGTPIGYGHVYRTERATTIATVPIGYGDGYPRLAGGRSHVVLGSRRLPVAGRVSMDQCTIDADDAAVRVGDEVELWGESVRIEEVAVAAQTIAYEILTGVSRRVPRIFVRGQQQVGMRTLLADSSASLAKVQWQLR